MNATERALLQWVAVQSELEPAFSNHCWVPFQPVPPMEIDACLAAERKGLLEVEHSLRGMQVRLTPPGWRALGSVAA